MSDSLYIGGVRRERVTFTDDAGVLADPATVTFTITPPEATAAVTWTYPTEITRETAGIYYLDWPCAVEGDHVGKWEGVGGDLSSAVVAAQWTVRPLPYPFTPTVAVLANIMRARTTGPNGAATGQFTDDTEPTADQVQEAIFVALDDLTGRIGTVIPQHQHGLARNAIAYNAAHALELGYFPEQLQSERSPAIEYDRKWRDAMTALQQATGQGEGRRVTMLDTTPTRG